MVGKGMVSAERADVQYNYVLSASLDGGTLLSAVIQFLILGLTGAKLDWWGNRVYKQSKFTLFLDRI